MGIGDDSHCRTLLGHHLHVQALLIQVRFRHWLLDSCFEERPEGISDQTDWKRVKDAHASRILSVNHEEKNSISPSR